MVSDATRQFQQLAEAATGFRFGKREFVDSGVINLKCGAGQQRPSLSECHTTCGPQLL